jgi:rhodanese-related sulfurtransferase
MQQMSYKNLDAQMAETWLQEHKDAIILDVRTTGEFESGHLPNALHINYFDAGFAQNVSKLDKNQLYLVYCQSGGRSASAAEKMASLGFTSLYNLRGGIGLWRGKII